MILGLFLCVGCVPTTPDYVLHVIARYLSANPILKKSCMKSSILKPGKTVVPKLCTLKEHQCSFEFVERGTPKTTRLERYVKRSLQIEAIEFPNRDANGGRYPLVLGGTGLVL